MFIRYIAEHKSLSIHSKPFAQILEYPFYAFLNFFYKLRSQNKRQRETMTDKYKQINKFFEYPHDDKAEREKIRSTAKKGKHEHKKAEPALTYACAKEKEADGGDEDKDKVKKCCDGP
jgi:hypothetical protein